MSQSNNDVSRRRFLGTTVGGIVGAGVAGLGRRAVAAGAGQPVSQTDRSQGGHVLTPGPEGKRLGVAIVGLGKFGVGQIIPSFPSSSNVRLAALVSGDPDKAKAIAAHYNLDPKNIYDYKNFDRIKDNPDVDIVYIILPNALHAEYTIRAAQAGKHVLCEKPMATTEKDCQAMIEACKSAGTKLMIAYRVRYEPFNQKMIEWSREQKYGSVQFVVSDTTFDIGGANQWRLDPALSGGGSLVDIGIYSLNATRYLTGEEPTEVHAMTYSDRNDARFKHVEQSIAFQLRFPSGALANCTSSYGTALVNRYRVVGTKGWYGLDPATSYTGQRLFHGHDDIIEEERLTPKSHFAAEMDHFASCIVANKKPLTPGEEGLQDVKLMRLLYEAAQSRTTIRVA